MDQSPLKSPRKGMEDVDPNSQQLRHNFQAFGNPTFELPHRDDEAAAQHLVGRRCCSWPARQTGPLSVACCRSPVVL